MFITNAIVTAYCACRVCCGSSASGIDASGHPPKQGITIAIPRKYQLGSKVVINGRTYIGTDRTAKRWDGRFDIYFHKHADAVKFGKQKLTIRITR